MRRATRGKPAAQRVEPANPQRLSLTKGLSDVEGLVFARALTGWSYDSDNVVGVMPSSGFAGPAIGAIGIVRRSARGRRVPRACTVPV